MGYAVAERRALVLTFYRYEHADDSRASARFTGPGIEVSGDSADALAGSPLADGFWNGIAEVHLGAETLRLAKVVQWGADHYADVDGRDLTSVAFGPTLERALSVAAFGRDAGYSGGIGSGMRVAARGGDVLVENIGVGEALPSLDGPDVQVIWHGVRRVQALGPLAPVRIVPFGFGAWPVRPLILGPAQRLVIDDWSIEAQFGSRYGVGEAIGQAGWGRAHVAEDMGAVTYHLIALNRPAAIMVEGAPCLSFSPSERELALLEPSLRASFDAADVPKHTNPLPVLGGRDVRRIVDRW